MESVIIKDKRFEVNIPAAKIDQRVKELGAKLNEDLKDTRPIFVSVLNGSFIFAVDLFSEIKMEAEITFIRVSSYSGTESTGTVKSVVGIKENLEGRTVVIIEDIVDTGDTAIYLIDELKTQNPEKILFASLLLKPDALRHPVKIDYVGFEVPNDFLVGYGLDYDGLGRNLKDIYKLA